MRVPASHVLAAFEVAGEPVPLAGGMGASWRIGNRVLKPVDHHSQHVAWQAELFSSIPCQGFRVARPQRAADGSLVVDGWCAWEWVEGRHEEQRWADIIAVGERFHAALAGLPRPDFIDRRTDPWVIGDRVGWGELPAGDFARVKHLARLVAALRSVDEPAQLIHGELERKRPLRGPAPAGDHRLLALLAADGVLLGGRSR